jgi:hypothetical protein
MYALKTLIEPALVAHACDPSYSGGSRFKASPEQIVLQDPILKNPSQKKELVEWLKVKILSSSHSNAKEKKRKC